MLVDRQTVIIHHNALLPYGKQSKNNQLLISF